MNIVKTIVLATIIPTTVTSRAADLYSMKVLSRGRKSKDIILMKVTGDRKTLSITIDACGTLMEFTTSDSATAQQKGFQDFVTKYTLQACEP